MSLRLRPYPDYKDSGVPWLGTIPKHWDQRALWTASKLRTQRNPGNLPLLSVFLDRGVIPYSEGGGQVHPPSLDLSSYQVVCEGDFVLNNSKLGAVQSGCPATTESLVRPTSYFASRRS